MDEADGSRRDVEETTRECGDDPGIPGADDDDGEFDMFILAICSDRVFILSIGLDGRPTEVATGEARYVA